MSNGALVSKVVLVAVVALSAMGCDDDANKSAGAAASSKPPPAASAPEPKPAPPPAPKPVVLRSDCPEGSKGEGTFSHPCEGSGDTRLMEATWTGKTDDKGPAFRVVNKSKLPILYGDIRVYFYDKSGKQLDAKGVKTKAKSCSGNIFAGPMKPSEKAVITFSCVKKDNVPDDATAIEAELEMVGFTDSDGEKNEFYWRNKDIAPDERPMEKGKKKKK